MEKHKPHLLTFYNNGAFHKWKFDSEHQAKTVRIDLMREYPNADFEIIDLTEMPDATVISVGRYHDITDCEMFNAILN